jgi:hypothetical protein
MSQATPNLPDDVQQRIDDYLDRVERVLLRGDVSRTERRSIVDEVETQIYEMLAARSEQDPATAITEILAGLDPPDAFAPDSKPALASASASGTSAFRPRALWHRSSQWWSVQPDRSRVSPPAVLAAVWSGTAVILAMAVAAFRWPPVPLVALLLLVGLTAPVGVTVLGLMAARRIRRVGSHEYGLPLALIETFFFPILFANLALIGVLAVSREVGLVLLAALVIITANIGLARYAWRRFGRQVLSRIDAL